MAELVSFIGIIFGAVLVLIGLLLIAPQVRVHQIRKYSAGSWVFRAGIGLSLIGLIALTFSDGIDELGPVGIVTGIAGLMGGLITWNHELVAGARCQGNSLGLAALPDPANVRDGCCRAGLGTARLNHVSENAPIRNLLMKISI